MKTITRRKVLKAAAAGGLAASVAYPWRYRPFARKRTGEAWGPFCPSAVDWSSSATRRNWAWTWRRRRSTRPVASWGIPLEVLYEDNKTDPKTSVERTTKVIQRDEVMAVVGPITSNARDAMAPTCERMKTPLLYATNYEGGACSRYIFCFNTVPNQELAKLLPYMNEHAGQSYYMFGADYIWPQRMFQSADGIVEALGGEVQGHRVYALGRQGVCTGHPSHRRQRRQGPDLRAARRRRHHLHQAGGELRPHGGGDRGLLRLSPRPISVPLVPAAARTCGWRRPWWPPATSQGCKDFVARVQGQCR